MPQCNYNSDMNVKISVGSYQKGAFAPRYEKFFKNTGTRLLTDSIARFIAGDENTYLRGSGRPNYLGFGTRGIVRQGNLDPRNPDNPNHEVLEEYFDDPNPPEFLKTRPWYNSDSLGGTFFEGTNLGIFWDPERGWGSYAEPDEPTLQGELCTRYGVSESQVVPRSPILSTEINSDCPNGEDYGEEGYKSTVIFRGASTAIWLERLLYPEHGPVLEQIAISEIGLYEKSNTDPHGLRTMLAGFRVPSSDIIYLQKDEVILVEWTITVQAIMPNEQVKTVIERKATGVDLDTESTGVNQLHFSGTVIGENNPRQTIWWSIDRQQASGTTIDNSGNFTYGSDETADYVQVRAVTQENPSINSKAAVVSLVKNNYPFGVTAYGVPLSYRNVEYVSTVIGKGTFPEEVDWSVSGQTSTNTQISDVGLLTLGLDERSTQIEVKAASVMEASVNGTSKVTLLTRVLDFTSEPAEEPCLTETVLGTLSAQSQRNKSICIVQISLRVVPVDSCTILIKVIDQNGVLAGFTREITGSSSHDLVLEAPVTITSAEHQLSVTIEGNVTVPTVSSILYGAFIEYATL